MTQQGDPLACLQAPGTVVRQLGPHVEARVPTADVAMVRFDQNSQLCS